MRQEVGKGLTEIWESCKNELLEAAKVIQCEKKINEWDNKSPSEDTPTFLINPPLLHIDSKSESLQDEKADKPNTYYYEMLPSPLIKPQPIPDSLTRMSQSNPEPELEDEPSDEYHDKDLGSELLFLQLGNNEDEEEDDYTDPQDFPAFESPGISPTLSRHESGYAMQQLLSYDGSGMRTVFDSYLNKKY